MEDDRFRDGLSILLDNHLQHLRSIKETEEKWLERMFALYGASIAWMATRPKLLEEIGTIQMAIFFLSPFVFAAFFLQHVMAKERLGYYRVMRSVIRAQNLFKLFEHGFLSQDMQSAAFPLGVGPNSQKDGTQPFSSFGYRQLSIHLFFVTFLGTACLVIAPLPLWLTLMIALINVIWLVHLYVMDHVKLYAAVLGEASQAGFRSEWLEKCQEASVPLNVNTHLSYWSAFRLLPKRWAVRTR